MCRPADIVARYGGEEFSIVLPDTNIQQAEVVGSRIIANFKKLAYEHEYSSTASHVTVSGGIAQFKTGQSAEELIKEADSALYKAKELGRNRFIN